MALTFKTIEGKSRSFNILAATLAVLTAAGFISFMLSYIKGHYLLGSSNAIPWGMPIIIAIYLIGLSAGSLILSSLTYVFRKEEYRPIARIAVFLAIILIFGAMIGIALDLGRPEKSWRLFMFFVLNNMRSMFAINGILYGGYFLIGLVYLGFIFAEKTKSTRTMGIVAICWAALVHMGTGAIFGFIATRPIFYSPIKPFEFLGAAMVSGLALLMITVVLIFKLVRRNFDRGVIFSLSKLLLILIITLSVMVLMDKLTHLYPPDREPTLWLFTGPFSWVFWGLQVGCAYVLPIILLTLPRFKKDLRWVMAAAVLVVIGIFGERFSLVIPGTAYPLPFYPGKIEGIWGMAGSFPITFIESFMSIGIFTLMGLFFILGLKYLELLPSDESREQAPEPAGKT
ncbi:MAG: NrfD/PsrC family molybdoenzyme membrane anchor subunit [Thermodesulfobacteriota bacterium]|jgi:molybdopterin-containing oxidoreductase family membrane subunit